MQRTPEIYGSRSLLARVCQTAIGLSLLAGASVSAQDYGSYTGDASIADAGTKVQLVTNKSTKRPSGILGYSEGPAVDAEGNLYFTEDQDENSGNIWKVGAGGNVVLFHSGPSRPNGLEFDPQGRLIACEKGSVSAFTNTGTRTPLAMNPALDADKRINDLTISSTGAMFFTNWDGNNVYYRSPDGVVKKYSGYRITNGIEWLEEKKILYLSQDGPDSVYRYEVDADGALKNEKRFAGIKEPDGMTVDEKGNLYVASWMDGKVQVFDSTGKELGSIAIKSAGTDTDALNGNASNCVFGGADFKTLFITGDGGAYKIPLKIAGRKRPGSTSIRRGLLRPPKSPARGLLAAHTLSGRVVEARLPVAIVLLMAPAAK